MAKVKIVGDAVVLTSELKLDDIKLVEKVCPKALSLYEEENGREVQVFSIATAKTEGFKGAVTESGITFGRASRDGGYAQITMGLPQVEGDVKEAVADLIGGPVMNLNKLEHELPCVIQDILDAKADMLDCIEIC